MLNLLKIKVTGFKLLEDNFEIDFTSRARVYEIDKSKEIFEVDKGLYLFRSMAFVGGNSSGKSTVLSLILKTLLLLQTGRWEFLSREFNKDKINLTIIFYLDGNLYNYKVSLGKIDYDKISIANHYSPIENESLIVLAYSKVRGIKSLELLETEGKEESELFKSSLKDTSAITKITSGKVNVDDFNNNNITNFNETIVRNTFFTSLNNCDRELVSSIIKLLDDNIEYIIYDNLGHVKFKRVNDKEMFISTNELIAILSAGTFRGVELYIRCIDSLRNGKTIIVDEIENSFQKNLLYNLLFLFNDEKINTKNAQLIFSTHYIEILDYLSRRDSIFITHKESGIINVKNLYSDYDVRTELLKSKQFDNNVFNTSINYQQLLKVRRLIVDELHPNND